jgi:FkbM family methyltransferase
MIDRLARSVWRGIKYLIFKSKRILKLPAQRFYYYDDHIYPSLKEGREPEFTENFENAIKPGDNVFDVGAHKGFFSLIAAFKLNGTGKVISFEPFNAAATELGYCMKTNKIDNVIIEKAGLGEDESIKQLRHKDRLDIGYIEGNPVIADAQPPDEICFTYTLDKYCEAMGIVPDVMKIDVAGDELRVLKGGEKTFKNSGIFLCLELHDTSELEDAKALLEEYNFKTLSVVDRRHVVGIFEKQE